MSTKILVVEDDDAIAALLMDELRGAGHDARLARDGDEALSAFARDGADLIVLDVMLPKKTGIQVCSTIRSRPGPQPIIVMLTARVAEVDAIVGYEVGADDYVRKPFKVRELISRIGSLLRLSARTRAAAGPAPLAFGALTIEHDSRQVKVDGTPLALTPMEFDMLAHIASTPGVVFRRDALLSEVWGYDHSGSLRTVDSHVTRVRRKLAAAGLTWEPIATVHGVGYRFVDDSR